MLLKSFDQGDCNIEMVVNNSTYDIKAKIGTFSESFSYDDYRQADVVFATLVAEAQQLEVKMELH